MAPKLEENRTVGPKDLGSNPVVISAYFFIK